MPKLKQGKSKQKFPIASVAIVIGTSLIIFYLINLSLNSNGVNINSPLQVSDISNFISLKAGDAAPDFSTKTIDGESLSLSEITTTLCGHLNLNNGSL